nr:MAG: hypothetical protein DIU68_16175 [Chloroflexota bacterium]
MVAGMISIELQPTDLANIRFAYSPLVELSMSYKRLRADGASLFPRWADEVRHALHDTPLPYMDALILPRDYVADFITPTPTRREVEIEEEFARVRETPHETIRKNVRTLIALDGESPERLHFLAHPDEALDRLLDEMRLYWNRTLAAYWPRIIDVLENDVLFRARELALDGAECLFVNLSPIVRFRPNVIQLHKEYYYCDPTTEYSLDGRGLNLVPVIFACRDLSWQVSPEWAPMFIYGARGAGLWYGAPLPDPEEALQLALGSGKARLLVALKTPAHTSELARRLNITSGAVSQQLGRLNQAGLVEPKRSSNKVYYHLTPRGQKLLELFAS